MSSINVNSWESIYDILCQIDEDDIHKYLKIRNGEIKDKEIIKDFKNECISIGFHPEYRDCLEEMWEDDIKDWCEWNNIYLNSAPEDDDYSIDEIDFEEIAKKFNNLSWHQYCQFFRELVKFHSQDKNKLKEFFNTRIDDI